MSIFDGSTFCRRDCRWRQPKFAHGEQNGRNAHSDRSQRLHRHHGDHGGDFEVGRREHIGAPRSAAGASGMVNTGATLTLDLVQRGRPFLKK